MYSRNTSKRSGYSRVNTLKVQNTDGNVDSKPDEEVDLNKGEYNDNSSENHTSFGGARNDMPIAPPNYRGMIYDMGNADNNSDNNAVE